MITKIISIISLGKQTFIMTSLFNRAGYMSSLGKKKWVYLNNLFCGEKKLWIDFNCVSFAGYAAVVSQSLEGSLFGQGRSKYNYKSEPFYKKKRLGRGVKPWSLRNFSKNVVSLLHGICFRYFFSEECNKTIKANTKYRNLIQVLANATFLQGVYQKIKLSQRV
jgi:hypothetical protein